MSTVVFGGKEETNFYDASKDGFSQKAGEISQGSYENSNIVQGVSLGNGYRGGRVLQVRKEFHSLFNGIGIYPDGVGTKVIPHASMGKQFIAAHDIAAMTLDDAITQGDGPTSFNSVLDARDISEDEEGFVCMLQELGSIAREQGVVLLAGETANLGSCIGTPDSKSKSAFNWAGFATSLKHPLINHASGNKTNFRKLEPGNVVVALEQGGFRSNGISAVRRAFEAQYGPNWYREAPQTELENAFQASKVYARAVGEALGWHNPFSEENVESDEFEFQVDIRGIAHLSGGSFEGKFREGLLEKSGVSAVLDNLYPTPEIVKKVFEWQKKIPEKLGKKSDVATLNDVYQTFCSGQGMLVVVGDQGEADKLLKILDKNNINARKAGIILDNDKSSSSSKLTITGAHIGID